MADYSEYPVELVCERHRRVRVTVRQFAETNSERDEDSIAGYVYFPHEAGLSSNPWRQIDFAEWARHPRTNAEQYTIHYNDMRREVGPVEPGFPVYVDEWFEGVFKTP